MKYNPNLNYTWSNEDKFEISGNDFGFLLNTIRGILETKEAKQILMADRANTIIENIIAEYVEKDVIKEIVVPADDKGK